MYKIIVAKDLRVGKTFLRVVTYLRFKATEFSLIKLESVISILAIKLYIGNIRAV